MNVYNEAHELTQAIKESQEYIQFEAAKAKVKQNPELDKNLADFRQKQISIQAAQMMGQQMDPNEMAQLQTLYGILMSDPLAAEYMQCEMRFSIMINDVMKIIGEVVDMGIDMGGNNAQSYIDTC